MGAVLRDIEVGAEVEARALCPLGVGLGDVDDVLEVVVDEVLVVGISLGEQADTFITTPL